MFKRRIIALSALTLIMMSVFAVTGTYAQQVLPGLNPGETRYIVTEITNTHFRPVNAWFTLKNVEPVENGIDSVITFGLWIDVDEDTGSCDEGADDKWVIEEDRHVSDIKDEAIYLGVFPVGSLIVVVSSYHMDEATGNWAQGKTITFDIELYIEENHLPVADAGGPYSGEEDQSISFDGSVSSDPDGSIVSYSWDFGDGESGTGVSPSHTYDDDGIYEVTLTVTDDDGLTDSDEATVTVEPEPESPAADAGGPYSGEEDQSISFDGSRSSDPDGSIVSYSWDFDASDGIQEDATVSNPSHFYLEEGTYTVTLTVTDDDGLTDSDEATVTVDPKSQTEFGPVYVLKSNKMPVANAGSNQTVYVDQIVEFSGGNSSDPDGYISSYLWDFGDGGEDSGVNVSHAYLEPGDYTVTLTVRDARGGEDSDTCTITVTETPRPPMPTPPLPPILNNLNITPAVVELGNNVTISFDIMNLDSQSINYGVDIYIENVNITRIWVDLGGNESKTVSHTITHDTVGTFNVTVHGMTGNFTVEAPEIPLRPAEFEVTDIVITPELVEPGDEVTISVLVTNIGEETGDYTVTLDCEDLPAGPYLRVQETVSLEGGESDRVEFEVSRNTEGTYALTVDGLPGNFTVEAPEPEPAPPGPANFVFSNLQITPDEEITPGEYLNITISVNATNKGEETGDYTVNLKLNGTVIDSYEVTLIGGASMTTFFKVTKGNGVYTVEVEGLTGSFTIDLPDDPIFVLGPGYVAGIMIVVVSSGAIVYLLWKGRFPSIYSPSA